VIRAVPPDDLLLRAVRENAASAQAPVESLTRQELAASVAHEAVTCGDESQDHVLRTADLRRRACVWRAELVDQTEGWIFTPGDAPQLLRPDIRPDAKRFGVAA
jgi:hypothetical protein